MTAVDNATKRANTITITNDKGRLTKEQIKKMIDDADKFKEHDQEMRAIIASKNDLESYVYQIRTMLADTNIASRISAVERNKVSQMCDTIKSWLETNEIYTERDYVIKKQELENLCKPIIIRLYSGNAPPTQTSNTNSGGPTIDEVD